MKANKLSLMLLSMLSFMLILSACGDSPADTVDGDTGTTTKDCLTDSDCFTIFSNFTCNSVAGKCIDQGLCDSNDFCFDLYGPSIQYCKENGVCSRESSTDGDTIVTDGDKPVIDGDTITDGDEDTTTDGDNITEDGDNNTEDGDLDYDTTEPELDVDYTPFACDSNSSLTVPTISVEPTSADFGAVAIMDSEDVQITLCNSSGVDLAITGIQFARGTSHEFYKYHDDLPIVIPAGFAVPVVVVYVPVDNVADSGTMVILSDDPNNPEIEIPLLSSIKASAYLKTVPQVVQFSGTTTSGTLTKLLQISNIGNAPASIESIQLENGDQSDFTIIDIQKNNVSVINSDPWTLEAEEQLMVTVGAEMHETMTDDRIDINWISSEGTKHTFVDVVVSNMSMCAVPEAGPDQFVDPLDIVYLNGSQSFDPNGEVQGYMWQFVKKPDNAFRAIIQDMNGNDIEGKWTQSPLAQFYAELAGEYVVALSLMDSEEECTEKNIDSVTINAKPESTIHVRLGWEKRLNDYDLHFIRPGGTHTRESQMSTGDCHYANCNTMNGLSWPCALRGCPGPSTAPDWGTLNQRFDDPFLDIDDIDEVGPENINYSSPELGDFKVTVENYSGDDENNTLTVDVFIFGVLVKTFTKEDYMEPYNHWNVCWIRVNSPTDIEVIEIDTVESSN